jgi:hypothetical protein
MMAEFPMQITGGRALRSLLPTLALGPVLAILVPATALIAQATDRAIGTWQLDVAKSQYDPGPAPKSLTVTYEKVGQGLKVTTKGVDGQGNPTATEYTANYDGKDYPATGAPDYNMVSLKRIDASTLHIMRKKGGKFVAILQRVVSADGKVLTIRTKGTNAKGETVNDVGVFEKQ